MKINGDIRFRFGCKSFTIEEPVELRAGAYDVKKIGAYTFLGGEGSILRNIDSIGRFCMIGPGAQFGLTEHPSNNISAHVLFEQNVLKQFPRKETLEFWRQNQHIIEEARDFNAQRAHARIQIGNDVWIGQGVTIARGVSIGDGAIIASKAVVTRDVEPYSVVGGVPAKRIRWRFTDEIRRRLIDLSWWDYGPAAMNGVNVTNVSDAIEKMESNVRNAEPYFPTTREVTPAVVKKLIAEQA